MHSSNIHERPYVIFAMYEWVMQCGLVDIFPKISISQQQKLSPEIFAYVEQFCGRSTEKFWFCSGIRENSFGRQSGSGKVELFCNICNNFQKNFFFIIFLPDFFCLHFGSTSTRTLLIDENEEQTLLCSRCGIVGWTFIITSPVIIEKSTIWLILCSLASVWKKKLQNWEI